MKSNTPKGNILLGVYLFKAYPIILILCETLRKPREITILVEYLKNQILIQ